MLIELFPLIGSEGLIVFSMIVVASIVLARVMAPYSTQSYFSSGSDLPKAKASADVRGKVVSNLPRSEIFHLPTVKSFALSDRKVAEATRYGRAVLGKGADLAGKASGSARVLFDAAGKAGQIASSSFSKSRKTRRVVFSSRSQSKFNAVPAQRLDVDQQWGRLTGVVAEGIEQAERIEDLHSAAARQLDAVDYAYEQMLDELQAVLPGVSHAKVVCRSNREDAYAAAAVDVSPALTAESEQPASFETPLYMPHRSGQRPAGSAISARELAEAHAA